MPAQVSACADRLILRLCQLQDPSRFFRMGSSWPHCRPVGGLPVAEGLHFVLYPASLSILGQDAAHGDRRVIILWNACSWVARP